MIGATISHYKILEKLGGQAWIISNPSLPVLCLHVVGQERFFVSAKPLRRSPAIDLHHPPLAALPLRVAA